MSAEELAAWLRDHPDAVVFRCGCIWTEPMMADVVDGLPEASFGAAARRAVSSF